MPNRVPAESKLFAKENYLHILGKLEQILQSHKLYARLFADSKHIVKVCLTVCKLFAWLNQILFVCEVFGKLFAY